MFARLSLVVGVHMAPVSQAKDWTRRLNQYVSFQTVSKEIVRYKAQTFKFVEQALCEHPRPWLLCFYSEVNFFGPLFINE